MKRFFTRAGWVLSLSLFFSFSIYGQVEVEWDKTLGGADDERLYALALTPEGGILVGGDSRSGASGDRTESSYGDLDYWIVKVDKEGNKLWDKAYGGTGEDHLTSIATTGDGGFLLAGYSGSGISGNKTAPSRGSSDFWIIKIDAMGNILWDRTFGGESWDRLRTVVQTEDGGFLLGGESNSSASGNKTAEALGSGDFWIVRTDADGNKLWDKAYGEVDITDNLANIALAPNGDFLLTGQSWIKTGEIVVDGETHIQTTSAFRVIRIDEHGSERWGNVYMSENENNRFVRDVLVTSDDGFLLIGDESHRSRDGYVIRMDGQGNVIWDRYYGGDAIDITFSAVKSPNGYLLGGESYSDISGDKTEAPIGDADFWILEIDTTGNVLWDKTIGSTGWESMVEMAALSDNEFLLAGFSSSDAYQDKTEDSRGESPYEQDYWLVKISTDLQEPEPEPQPQPTPGLVTGGGWFYSPAGAYEADPSAAGRAVFAINAGHKEGEEAARGTLVFILREAGLRFYSRSVDWLSVDGKQAFIQGSGRIGMEEGYHFLVSVLDQGPGVQATKDHFRMIIWDQEERIVYDSQRGEAHYSGADRAIASGSITIHQQGKSHPAFGREQELPMTARAIDGFRAYPAQLNGEGLWLEFPAMEASQPLKIAIYDIQGRKMAARSFETGEQGGKQLWKLDHEHWASGIYLLRVESHKLNHQQKLIK